MGIIFLLSSSGNHGTAANPAVVIGAAALVITLVARWLGRSVRRHQTRRVHLTHQQQATRDDAGADIVRACLVLAVLCPVVFVTLYEVFHAGTG
jgi:ABC-type Fe3+ transport system permease subunit